MAIKYCIEQKGETLTGIVKEAVHIQSELKRKGLENNAQNQEVLKEAMKAKLNKQGFENVLTNHDAKGIYFISSSKIELTEDSIPSVLKPIIDQNKEYGKETVIPVEKIMPENKIIETLPEKYPLKNQFGYNNALSIEVKELETQKGKKYFAQSFNVSGKVKKDSEGKLTMMAFIPLSKKQVEGENGKTMVKRYISKINKTFDLKTRLSEDQEGNYKIPVFIKLEDDMLQYEGKHAVMTFAKFYNKKVTKLNSQKEEFQADQTSGYPTFVEVFEIQKKQEQEVNQEASAKIDQTPAPEQTPKEEEEVKPKKKNKIKDEIPF